MTAGPRRSGFALALAVCVGLPPIAAAAEPVEVTYIANEGFLIARGERKVLVDALFPGIRHYAAPGPERLAAMAAGEAPFDGVDLVLATHFHRDHFGASEVRRFLAGHPEAVFVSTPEAVAELGTDGTAGERVRALLPEEGERVALEVAGIGLTALNLHHGRSPEAAQNLGFMIDLDGFRVLHVGDTEVSAAEVRPLGLDEARIDLALLPVWLLAEPAWSGLVEAIAPRALVAMHVAEPSAPASWFGSAGGRAARLERIRARFPRSWVATTPLERRSYSTGSTGTRSQSR